MDIKWSVFCGKNAIAVSGFCCYFAEAGQPGWAVTRVFQHPDFIRGNSNWQYGKKPIKWTIKSRDRNPKPISWNNAEAGKGNGNGNGNPAWNLSRHRNCGRVNLEWNKKRIPRMLSIQWQIHMRPCRAAEYERGTAHGPSLNSVFPALREKGYFYRDINI